MAADEERTSASSNFGTLLRRHRLAAGLSQEALAARAQMSTQGIGALERGDRRTPQRGTLALLAEALGLDVEQRREFEAAAARPKMLRPGDGRVWRTLAPAVDESATPNNLPRQLTSLIGCETVVAEVAALIRKSPLVTLVGSGGVGKTRISLQVAANLLDTFDDGVWFIELAPLSSGEYLPSTVAQILSIQLHSAGDPLELLIDELRSKDALLIFDNCEHLVDAAGRMVAAILRGSPRIRVLASSRQSLGVSGETTFRIPSLPTPDAVTNLTGADARQYPAIALFAERAAAVDDHFALTDENAPAVGEVCRRLDGIPLAIELAAARTTMLNPRQLRDRLDDRFRLLTGGGHDLLPRHQTLRATLDWSFGLLDENERVLARRLGVFVNGFTLEGAVAVGSGEDMDHADVFDGLASLVDKSLVLADDDGAMRRYRMLESTRAYLREKLEAAGELPCLLRQHLRYVRNLFAVARTRAERSGRSTELNALLVAELEDVRMALAYAAGNTEALTGAELLVAIGDRLDRIGLNSEGSALLECFIRLLPAEERVLRSRLWTAIARTARTDRVRALEASFAAVSLARNASDDAALADALIVYATSLVHARRFEDTASALTEAEALASTDNVWLHLRIVFTRAHLNLETGNLDAAAEAYEWLRKVNQQLGNATQANGIAITLAELQHQRGQTTTAVALAQEVLGALRADRDRQSLVGALANLCGYLIALDRLSEARAVALEAFRISSDHDRRGIFVTDAVEHAALTAALSNDLESSAKLAGYAGAAFQRLGYQREYTERKTRTRLESLLSKKLAPVEHDSLLATGATLSPEAAIGLAIESLST
ncbi:MAG: helix-turn-helix domain-containing protein [Candidatus Cybelea sp.]